MRLHGVSVPGLATFVAATALLSAGCSNNPYPPGESAGNTLYRTIGVDPRTLDPSVSFSIHEALVVDVIYPSFYKYHYLKRDPFELELNIGAKEPVREPWGANGGERYTFTLKPGLRFQDDPCFPGGRGRAITAADVVYAFKRMADPRVESPFFGQLEERVVGWREYAAEFGTLGDRNYDREMAGVQVSASDPLTFSVTLSQPYPQLKYLMAMHFTAPQAREAVEHYGEEYARHPVGSGPYTLAEFKSKQRLVLTKNPHRHRAFYPSEGEPEDAEAGLLSDAGKELPLTDRVVVNIIREKTTLWNLFTQGYLDSSGVGANNYRQVFTPGGDFSPDLAKRGVRVLRYMDASVWYAIFNMEDPVWGGLGEKQKKMRQAVALALDSRELIALLLQGQAIPANWIIPPGIPGYDASFRNPYRAADPGMARAKALLAEAGYPGGVDAKTGERLTLYYDNTATTAAERQAAQRVTGMIERLGVNVESRATTVPLHAEKVKAGRYQFAFGHGYQADYPDAENFAALLCGANARSGLNESRYRSPEYDRLYARMRTLPEGPERDRLLGRMRAVAVEDCPVVFLYHPRPAVLAYDWTRNVKEHPVAYDTLVYWGVDGERRALRQRDWNRPIWTPLLVLGAMLGIGLSLAARDVHRHRRRRLRVRTPS